MSIAETDEKEQQRWNRYLVLGGSIFAVVMLINLLGLVSGLTSGHVERDRLTKSSKVKYNMRICQVAAEDYARDHLGLYPTSADDSAFRSYFPGGRPPDRAGTPPTNPVSAAPEWPINGNVRSVSTARQESKALIKSGAVEYSVVYDATKKPLNYAIRGGDASGSAVIDNQNRVMVFANHD